MNLFNFMYLSKFIDLCNFDIFNFGVYNFKINIKIYWIFIILFCIVLFLIITIIISYFLFKILKISIEDNNIFFYNYNKQTQQILDKYGNEQISQDYIIKQPLNNYINLFLNIITLYNYQKLIDTNNEFMPYHTTIVVKIKTSNKLNKFLLIEKNSSVNISENFNINNKQYIKSVCIKNKKYTLNQILNSTCERIGIKKFFNWHFHKNNCQEFIREILITLHKLKNNDSFISHDKMLNLLNASEFTVYIINFITIVGFFFEKYLYITIC